MLQVGRWVPAYSRTVQVRLQRARLRSAPRGHARLDTARLLRLMPMAHTLSHIFAHPLCGRLCLCPLRRTYRFVGPDKEQTLYHIPYPRVPPNRRLLAPPDFSAVSFA